MATIGDILIPAKWTLLSDLMNQQKGTQIQENIGYSLQNNDSNSPILFFDGTSVPDNDSLESSRLYYRDLAEYQKSSGDLYVRALDNEAKLTVWNNQ